MDAVGVIAIMFTGLWLFLPAMVPNSAAVVFGGETKMDFGKSWKGKRILGDGKSWRGFFGGAFSGIVFGFILLGISALFGSEDYWGYGPFWENVGIIATLSFGALLGDVCADNLLVRVDTDLHHPADDVDDGVRYGKTVC